MFNFLKKNNIFIILFFLTLSLSLSLIIFYWKYPFVDQKINSNYSKYEEIINKINTKNPNNLYEADNFIIQNHNIYGTLTALSLSKKYILYNKLDKALISLQKSLQYTQEENLKILLKLNIIKIKVEKNENKEAMKMLENIHNHNWDNIIENIKGDIFIKINNQKEAIKSWKKSFSLENSNVSKEIINMKINELKE